MGEAAIARTQSRFRALPGWVLNIYGRLIKGIQNMSNERQISEGDQNELQAALSVEAINTFIEDHGVLKDNNLSLAFGQKLENAGLLPKIAMDTFASPDVQAALSGENGQMDRTRLKDAADSGMAGGTQLDNSARVVAKVMLDRWDEIDTDKVPGISPQELKDWAAKIKPENRAEGTQTHSRTDAKGDALN